uniref:Ig-like domain-containing protein n=1 Tax=Pygocentrus nattereri TaxID=42514 RepID=A0AAR2IZN9_PYGNA
MTFYLNLFVNSIQLLGVFGADEIRPSEDQKTVVFRKEGEPVTLKCSYKTSRQYVYLYWYRQYPNRALQYLLYRGARSGTGAGNTADHGFESTAEVDEVHKSYTALYYCALQAGAQ